MEDSFKGSLLQGEKSEIMRYKIRNEKKGKMDWGNIYETKIPKSWF